MVRRSLAHATRAIEGIGLFSGRPGRVVVHPGEAGHGIWFERADLPGKPRVRASVEHVTGDPRLCGLPPGVSPRNTTLAREGESFAMTIEHVMSALAGLGVWDAIVELDGPEVPILDGSAAGFVEAIDRAMGEGGTPAKPLVVRSPIPGAGDAASIGVKPWPYEGFHIEYVLDYGSGSPIRAGSAYWTGDADAYRREIAPARTFSLLSEAKAMQGAGLFRHLTPRDMLVIADDGRPADNTLRFEDEPVRHKLLDLIGDLALLGRPVRAEIVATKSGHAMTHALVRRLEDL